MEQEQQIGKCQVPFCDTPRHSKANQYCKKCRSAYQKSIRLRKAPATEACPTCGSTGKQRPGRPERPIDERVQYFLDKHKAKNHEE